MLITLFITSARPVYFYFFFFNDTATTEIYTLSLHDALPISIKQVRAFTLKGGGADYHDQSDGHWIDDHIATPMAKYPEYRQSRRSFGINVLGTLVVEIEDSAGRVGFAVTTGGEPAAYIVEKHLARFLEGEIGRASCRERV